jgi:hypothetical protein
VAVVKPFTFNFDQNPILKPVERVYHGTRISPSVIMDNGLCYPGDVLLLTMVKRAMEVAGFSYADWLLNEEKKSRKGDLTKIWELQQPYRRKVWVTDQLDLAWSYARRAPEIVTEAVRGEYYRKHPRKKNGIEECEALIDRCVADIGQPIVVEIDAQRISAKGGVNEPLTQHIPKDAIIKILDTSQMIPERRW